MTGSNRRPSACKADALPAELITHYRVLIFFRIAALFLVRPFAYQVVCLRVLTAVRLALRKNLSHIKSVVEVKYSTI